MVRDLSLYKDKDGHYMTRSRNPELYDSEFNDVFAVSDVNIVERKSEKFY